jgi:uncharacterized protein YkwD
MDTPSTLRGLVLRIFLLAGLAMALLPAKPAVAQSSPSTDFLQDEAQTIYLVNLERAAQGAPPLRWNRELTLAARGFSYDSVINRPNGYCGHEDSLGRRPGERLTTYGYVNMVTWAENVLCGLGSAEATVDAWMRSDGHRMAMLDPALREVGVGFFQDTDSRRGYITMDMAIDDTYAPVIINQEAPQTSSPDVTLYIYSPEANDGFRGMGPAVEMMISNSPTFDDGVWEPYVTERSWQLEPGTGWRTVYVRQRDAMGRGATMSDTIYLGAEAAWDEASLESLATTIEAAVEFESLPVDDAEYAQFRLNWLADDTHPAFKFVYGDGEQVADDAARGGSAYRMNGDGFEAEAVVRTYHFIQDVPLVAYVRLKVADNTASDAFVELTVNGGGTIYGPVYARATDFAEAGQYQAFAVPFTYHSDGDNPFLEVWMRTEGTTDFFFDTVSFYTQDITVETPLTWSVPEGQYRGQSIWMRQSDGAGTVGDAVEISAAASDEPMLLVTPAPSEYTFEVNGDVVSPASVAIRVTCEDCAELDWDVSCDASWITLYEQQDQLIVSIDAASLPPSDYTTTIEISVPASPEIEPVELSVDVIVVAPEPEDDTQPWEDDDQTITPEVPEHFIFLPYTMRQ